MVFTRGVGDAGGCVRRFLGLVVEGVCDIFGFTGGIRSFKEIDRTGRFPQTERIFPHPPEDKKKKYHRLATPREFHCERIVPFPATLVKEPPRRSETISSHEMCY